MEGNGITKLPFISTVFILLLLLAGCNQKPSLDMNEVLSKTQEDLRGLDEIETTAASFNGKSDVKFRLMVEEHPTQEEALKLFNKIIESVIQNSNHSDVWDYYNGYFDIKSYDDGVIYEATKLIGEDLDTMIRKHHENE